jgi:hypothetical protein
MAGQLTIDTLKASSGVLATQNGMTGIAKAWVNYNGITNTILGSFNVSSITVNGTGDYSANFSTAMPNATYSAVMVKTCQASGAYGFSGITSQTTSAVRVVSMNNAGAVQNDSIINVAVLGN